MELANGRRNGFHEWGQLVFQKGTRELEGKDPEIFFLQTLGLCSLILLLLITLRVPGQNNKILNKFTFNIWYYYLVISLIFFNTDRFPKKKTGN
jgi:hypothetical protein